MVHSPAVRVTAVMLVLGVAVATVSAFATPSVMEARAGWKARAPRSASMASTASADPKEQSYAANSEEGYYEEKEICLQEIARRDCSAQRDDHCSAGGGTGCSAPHAQWTSDVACCQHKEGYGGGYGYGHGSASVGDHLWGPHSSIGSCDWMTHWVPDVPVTTNINKYGSASAICYFGADSQECGGPFCDRMVMTLEGALYFVDTVYSYSTPTTTATGLCTSFNFPGIQPRLIGGGREAAPDQKQAQPAPTQQPAGTARTASDASVQYNYGHYEGEQHHTSTVYGGTAYVINGVVTAMVGPKKEKWENGLFEYVVQFTLDPIAFPGNPPGVVTNMDASIPWVRDKTYKFTFYKANGYY